MTPKGEQLARSLAHTFALIRELQKDSPADADQLFAMIVTHIKSARPQALSTLDTGPVGKVGL